MITIKEYVNNSSTFNVHMPSCIHSITGELEKDKVNIAVLDSSNEISYYNIPFDGFNTSKKFISEGKTKISFVIKDKVLYINPVFNQESACATAFPLKEFKSGKSHYFFIQ